MDKKGPLARPTKEVFLKGSLMGLIITIPSLSAFFIAWSVTGDKYVALVVGIVVHFIGMGFSLGSFCCDGSLGWPFYLAAILMALYAMIQAIQLIGLGDKINGEGGRPQGDVFKRIGIVDIVCSVLVIIAAICCWADLGTSSATGMGAFASSLVGIIALIGGFASEIWGFIDK